MGRGRATRPLPDKSAAPPITRKESKNARFWRMQAVFGKLRNEPGAHEIGLADGAAANTTQSEERWVGQSTPPSSVPPGSAPPAWLVHSQAILERNRLDSERVALAAATALSAVLHMPGGNQPDPFTLLGLVRADTSEEALKQRYRLLVKRHHPDRGGRQQDFVALNHAYRAALSCVRNG